MAAPEYVPVLPSTDPRTYGSPPRRPASWTADRPGDISGVGQPDGQMLGNQGPDLGFALKIARQMSDRLVLTDGEHLDDVIAGCTAVAMKRSSLFGRAPVVHDLTVAFTVWGFLDEAPAELVELRRGLFAEASTHHHWTARRRIADMVPDEVLQRPVSRVTTGSGEWRRLLDLPTPA
ncbi:MAG: hypothetical protein ACXIVQ_00270 [Acidimicrobiales bacterium]